ncbi:hypothetical protein PI124_g17036 [Phytophthora idaei]|nr:hypothetical protein PI124_g17036 [Phytophthora idaei]
MARIRSSVASMDSAVAQAVRDVDFKHLWWQLLIAEWTTKRPTGNLSNEWTYTSPKGIYFVGEGAVVAYVLSRGTVGANDSGSDKDSDTEVAAVTDKACEKIPQDR